VKLRHFRPEKPGADEEGGAWFGGIRILDLKTEGKEVEATSQNSDGERCGLLTGRSVPW